LPIPDFIGRVNVYYQAPAFKKAATIQAGMKFIISQNLHPETFLQFLMSIFCREPTLIPLVVADCRCLFNMKVKRMFFYVEGQHINQTFMQNKSFTAPDYPIYDFRLNLGVVWYLFH
jgi:hypothetical protein